MFDIFTIRFYTFHVFQFIVFEECDVFPPQKKIIEMISDEISCDLIRFLFFGERNDLLSFFVLILNRVISLPYGHRIKLGRLRVLTKININSGSIF